MVTRRRNASIDVRKAYKMYIGGAFVRSESGRYRQLPHTPDNIPLASRKDVRDAVTAARSAWSGWSERNAANRGQIVYRLSEMLHARRAELTERLRANGAMERQARREVEATIDRVVAYAGWADKYQSLLASSNPVAGPHFTFTVPESMGVVAIVAPQRPALLGLAGATLPVILSGNTCVVLASEADPRVALTFSESLATSDLPGGVVNVLTGQVAELLPHIAKHMEIAALDLHGVEASLAKSAEELAAINVKRVSVRELDERAWLDAAAESPRWIERFVELKTISAPVRDVTASLLECAEIRFDLGGSMPRILPSRLALLVPLLGACASTAPPAHDDASYVLAYLKTGPLSATKTEEEKQTIFSGHMANINRLALERKLVIAGPFNQPHDSSWRGIFVLDVPTIEGARELVDTDPGVKEQVFVVELCPLRASPALRTMLDLENEAKAAAARSGEPPTQFNVRPYVMITAKDGERAGAALAPLRDQGRVVWSGSFAGARAGEAVFVIDAQTVEDAEKLLGEARPNLGDCSIDSWWSSKSLIGLAAAR